MDEVEEEEEDEEDDEESNNGDEEEGGNTEDTDAGVRTSSSIGSSVSLSTTSSSLCRDNRTPQSEHRVG